MQEGEPGGNVMAAGEREQVSQKSHGATVRGAGAMTAMGSSIVLVTAFGLYV